MMRNIDVTNFEVRPDPEVVDEIARTDVPIAKMISEAEKFVDGSEEQDLAVARYFIDKGHSEQFAGWIVREANTRRAAG